ncbi:hypothetical protein [Methanorbis rubei]|uniref:Uncharacterized protein n=1 Tax=Methanorbis rubei TaxID=3028300 RepID=A0AAE4SCA9_9EURY|nr:hypothetical protein [Methanocorpusculaceae archaeon Cs1]
MKKSTALITLLLICVLVLGLWMILSMDVQDAKPPVFTIPGHSIVISSGDSTGLELSQGFQTATQNYGPIQIPDVFSTKTTDSGSFTLLSFVELHPEEWKNLTLPITLYGQPYTAEMTAVSPGFIVFGDPNGVRTMYKGTITDLPNSRIELLITDTNLISGVIYLTDDCIYISPVQNREYTRNTTNPLHVAYSDRELPRPSQNPMPIDRL